jgi:O-antigen ligase
MSKRALSNLPFLPSLPFGLLAVLLALLWFAGGASRADVIGQVVTRAGSWAILIVLILFAARPRWQLVAPVAWFVLAAIALVVLQLIPLPPSVWTALPGRGLLAQAAIVTGQEQPWRPLSISPGATVNALSSLIVPLVMLLLLAGLTQAEHRRMILLFLGLVLASSLIGLLQFSGTRFDHPMVNDVGGFVSASFANRNHFALFAAIGCLMALVWGFQDRHVPRWKVLVTIALLLLFGLIILATGSRTGMLAGALGIGTGLLIVHHRIASELRRLPRWASVSLVVGVLVLLGGAVLLSMTLNRAVSLERALALEVGDDLRQQALPTVLAMIVMYFPAGTGAGTFDPAYRISERTDLLGLQYFNRAHNDLLEVVLELGLPALLLLGVAIGWWFWMSVRAWRAKDNSQSLLPRLGSGILLLVLVASATDYPVRTPMIMAIMVTAAVWLSGRVRDVTTRSTISQQRLRSGE